MPGIHFKFFFLSVLSKQCTFCIVVYSNRLDVSSSVKEDIYKKLYYVNIWIFRVGKWQDKSLLCVLQPQDQETCSHLWHGWTQCIILWILSSSSSNWAEIVSRSRTMFPSTSANQHLNGLGKNKLYWCDCQTLPKLTDDIAGS